MFALDKPRSTATIPGFSPGNINEISTPRIRKPSSVDDDAAVKSDMAGLIPEETIAEVRDRTDIVQVIGQYVQLKRSGSNFVGLCPFHNEKTGSFNVNRTKQFFHCFGCHESGDVFTFMQKIEHRTFTEVVEDLAARSNVEIKFKEGSRRGAKDAARRRSERQQGIEINGKVAQLYREQLQGSGGQAARDYLRQRGVSDAVAEVFRLGCAPATGSVVVRLVQQQKVPPEFAIKMGLIARRRSGDGFHDRFWKRLMFPVTSPSGEVVAFGGRMLGEGDGPKYINTPETPVYRKGEVMFGLQAAAPAVRRSGVVLLVEGNLDVIMMYQHGLENTLAPMGTALTPQQVRLLGRMADEVVAIFDGDDAGRAAAVKCIPLLVDGGVEGKIATLPREHDPDSLLRQQGREAMTRLIKQAVPAVDFYIAHFQDRMEDSIPGRARVLEQVVPLISRLSSTVARDMYADRLASSLSVDRATVQRAVRAGRAPLLKDLQQQQQPAPPQRQLSPVERFELKLIALLVEHPLLVDRAEQHGTERLLTNEGLRATYKAAVAMQQQTGRIVHATLLQSSPPEVLDFVAKEIHSDEFANDGDPTQALDDTIAQLRLGELRRELDEIRRQIVTAKKNADLETVGLLSVRRVELEREIHETR